MLGRSTTLALVVTVSASAAILAEGRSKPLGRAIVQYHSDDVRAVASYQYSQRNHDAAWLLIQFGLQAMRSIEIQRGQLSLVGPDGRRFSVASQAQFLEDSGTLTRLSLNASFWARPLATYFPAPSTVGAIRFFAKPGGLLADSVAIHSEGVATGDLLFKTSDEKWSAGSYRLVLNHDRARVELAIELE